MDNSNYTDQQIDDFIMGRLDKKEETLFLQALTANSDLKLQVNARKELIQGIEAYHGEALKSKLKNIHSKNFTTTQKPSAKKRNLIPWLAAAATIALLVVALLWINQPASTSELFASNFKPFELNIAQRDDSNTDLLRLEQLYNQKQYETALPLFDSMLKANGNAMPLQLGAGISKLALGQPEEALTHFNVIITSGDLLFKDHALWYAALARLNMDDKAGAKLFLESLTSNEEADHYEEALELLGDLD